MSELHIAERVWDERTKNKKSFVDIAFEFDLGSKQWAQQLFEQEDWRRRCDELRKEFPEKVEYMEPASEYLKRTDPDEAEKTPGLSKRAFKALNQTGVDSVYDLAGVTRQQLQGLPNFGRKTYKEITGLMTRYGIAFMEAH